MLLAIEGIDGSGKNTQTQRLRDMLEQEGLSVSYVSFPRYNETNFAACIADYLNGKYGAVDAVNSYLSSLLFAGDRFESRNKIDVLSNSNEIVLLDRYVSSNLAYQAAKLVPSEREEFIAWLSRIEYEVFKLPKADLTIFLDMPISVAAKLLLQKKKRIYTDLPADIHEQDTNYLAKCRDVYINLAARNHFSHWTCINCVNEQNHVRNVQEIHELIWQSIYPYISNVLNRETRGNV